MADVVEGVVSRDTVRSAGGVLARVGSLAREPLKQEVIWRPPIEVRGQVCRERWQIRRGHLQHEGSRRRQRVAYGCTWHGMASLQRGGQRVYMAWQGISTKGLPAGARDRRAGRTAAERAGYAPMGCEASTPSDRVRGMSGLVIGPSRHRDDCQMG